MTASTASARTPSRPGARVRVFVVSSCPRGVPVRGDTGAMLTKRQAHIQEKRRWASTPLPRSADPAIGAGGGDGTGHHVGQAPGSAEGRALEGRAVPPGQPNAQHFRNGIGVTGIVKCV